MRTMKVTAETEGGTKEILEVPNPVGEEDVGALNAELILLGVYAGEVPTDHKRVGEIAAGLAARATALERWVSAYGHHEAGCEGLAATLDGGAVECTCGFRELVPAVDAQQFRDSTREAKPDGADGA